MNNPLSLVPLRMPFHNAHLLAHEQVAELDNAPDFNAALAAMCPQVDGTGSAPFFIGRSFAVPNTSRVAHTLYVIAHLAPVECDTLIMDNQSTSDTIPYNEILNDNISLEHEAKVSKVSEEQLFYLMSRGISEEEATEMIVMGFIEPFTKELPMEYAVEMNRLIKFEMEGSIG